MGYVAKTRASETTGRDTSYQGRLDYNGDRYGVVADHTVIEENFSPEIGFVARDNFRRTNVQGRFSPRPASIALVRRFIFQGNVDYYVKADDSLLQTRERNVSFTAEFENSDLLTATLFNWHELLEQPFEIGDGVVLPIGEYDFSNASMSYTLGGQRRVSGQISFQAGEFWNGDIRTLEFSSGRINIVNPFSIEPNVSVNWIDLPQGAFNTTLLSSRFNYAFNPRTFLSALLQYNTGNDRVSANLRFRMEYKPGSELFVVFTEERDAGTLGS